MADYSMTKDLAGAVNQALSPGKVAVMALTTLKALIIIGLLGYLGGLIEKAGLQWLAWIIQVVGLLLGFLTIVVGMTAVTWMDVQGKTGMASLFGIIGISIRNMPKVICAVTRPVIMILLGIGVILGLGLLGLIPKAGPVIWGIAPGIIATVAGIMVSLWIFKLLLGIFVLPAIIAEGKSDEKSYYKVMAEFVKGHLFPLLGRFAVAIILIMLFLSIIDGGIDIAKNMTPLTMGENQTAIHYGPLKRFLPIVGGVDIYPLFKLQAVDFGGAYRKAYVRRGPEKTEHKIGGWIYTFELAALISVVFGMVFIFFAATGRKAYDALKDQPVVEIKAPTVDVDAMRKKAGATIAKVKKAAQETEIQQTFDEPAKEETPETETGPPKEEGDQ
jgi:hypothetical protein